MAHQHADDRTAEATAERPMSAHPSAGPEPGPATPEPGTTAAPEPADGSVAASADGSGEAPVERADARPQPRRRGADASPPSRRGSKPAERAGDRAFRRATVVTAASVLVLIAGIAYFLLDRALPAINKDSVNFLTERTWFPDNSPPVFGIAALTYGTLVSALLALVMAVPVAVGVALAITQYAPGRVGRLIGNLVDLLAAVPSVVFGLWGLIFLVPRMIPLSAWLARYFGWIPIFTSDGIFGKSLFTASVVLAIMILPIITALSREVFRQVPDAHKEAAYALGATRWEMVRLAVLPYGRPGVISAVVLGFGRAIGETIAVALVLSANYDISSHILTPGGNTIAANIANTYGDAGPVGQGALIASGLVLFGVTLVVNFAARAIVARRKDFRGAAA